MNGEFITPDMLADELEKCQRNNNEPNVRACELFLSMTDSFLRQPSYARYKPDVKEDMRSAALAKCIRSIKNYRPERRATCFGYYTLAIQSAVLDYLRRYYYRHINITREATRRYAHELARTNPLAAQKILDGLLESNTTDTLNDAQKNRNRHNRRK